MWCHSEFCLYFFNHFLKLFPSNNILFFEKPECTFLNSILLPRYYFFQFLFGLTNTIALYFIKLQLRSLLNQPSIILRRFYWFQVPNNIKLG